MTEFTLIDNSSEALYGVMVFMLSLIIVPVGCLGYSYFQREVVHREANEQLVGRALGGQAEKQGDA